MLHERARLSGRDRCVICGGSDVRALVECKSNIPAVSPRYSVGSCLSCGLARIVPKPSPAELDAAYAATPLPGAPADDSPDEAPSFIRRAWRRLNRRESVARWVRGPAVADVGCNTGDLMVSLKRGGHAVTGYERSQAAVRIARERGLEVFECDVDRLVLPRAGYDSVVLSHVLEHVSDPVDVVRRCAPGLKAGGRLVVQVPNLDSPARRLFGRHWHGWDVPYHLWHFNAQTLAATLAAGGLSEVVIHGHTSAEDFTRSFQKMRKGSGRLLWLRALLVPVALLLEKLGHYSVLTAVSFARSVDRTSHG